MADEKIYEIGSKKTQELELTSGYHAMHLEAYSGPPPQSNQSEKNETVETTPSVAKKVYEFKLNNSTFEFNNAGDVVKWTNKDKKERTYTYHDPTAERTHLLGDKTQPVYQDQNGTYFQYEKSVPVAKLFTRNPEGVTYSDLRGFKKDENFPRALDAAKYPVVVPIQLKGDPKLNQTLDSVTDSDGHVWKRETEGKPLVEYVRDAAGVLKPTGSVATDKDLLPAEWYLPHHQQLYGDPDHPEASISITAIQQRELADCYWEGSVGSQSARSPKKIADIIVDNKDGTYTVKFPLADSDFKNPDTAKTGNKEQSATPNPPTLDVTVEAPTAIELAKFNAAYDKRGDVGYWSTVLEKAHRYLTGNIEEDNGGYAPDAMQLLTGSRRLDIFHRPDDNASDGYSELKLTDDPHTSFNWDTKSSNWVQNIENALASNQPVTAATPKIENRQWLEEKDDKKHVPVQLPDNHVFTVVAVEHSATDDKAQIVVRNPMGQVLEDDKTALESDKNSDGYLTLSPEDFEKVFSQVYINDK